MKRMRTMLSQYDAAVWVRVFGSALTSTTNFMLRPFLVLYLYKQMDGSILLPLLIVGLQPLASIVISLWGGGLADRFGRKPVMMISLLVQTLSMTGFIFAHSVWAFAALSFLNGFGVPLFVPAANAQIADLVPQEKRAEVFALLHTAFNVGPAIGPLLGLAVFAWNQQLVFAASAVAFGLYALLVWRMVPETFPQEARKQLQTAPQLAMGRHKRLYLFTLFAVPIGLLYAQVETTLPLHLQAGFDNSLTILATLFTINALLVMVAMVWIAKKTEKVASEKLIFLTYLLFGVVAVGYGYAPTFAILILNELVFSFAEMIGMSHLHKFVSVMAPTEVRGRYFSIFGMYQQIPKLVGPLLCGFLFHQYGGGVMFTVIGVVLVGGGLLQLRLMRSIQADRRAVQSQAQAVHS